jgi:hypothetical protein
MADIGENGISAEQDEVAATALEPTQADFNDEKVSGLISSGTWNKHPINVTSDGKILDGHHRWKAAMQLGEKIRVNRLGMPFDKLMDFVDGKPYTEKKGLMEGALEAKKEEFVKALKGKRSEFQKRYGDNWKSVMYSTATNMAKKETE